MKFQLSLLAIFMVFLSGCMFEPDKVETTGVDRWQFKTAKAQVTGVQFGNDQLILTGNDFLTVETVRMVGNGFGEDFTIESGKRISNT